MVTCPPETPLALAAGLFPGYVLIWASAARPLLPRRKRKLRLFAGFGVDPRVYNTGVIAGVVRGVVVVSR